MKRFKSLLLLSSIAILFIGNVGVNIFKHICEEDGVSVSYFINKGEEHCADHREDVPPCCEKEEEKNDDCCDDEVDLFQIKLDFYNNHTEGFAPITAVISNPLYVPTKTVLLDYYTSKYVNPPPPSSWEILLAKEVLVI